MDLMPSAYALNLIEVARQQDIDLLEATGLTIAELEAEVYIPLSLHQRVVNSFNRLTSDPAWAFDFGQRLGINAHGALGLAAVSAPTVSTRRRECLAKIWLANLSIPGTFAASCPMPVKQWR
jgi:hypothetical protein